MLSPDRPVVRAKGFQKPAPEPKETVPKYASSQQDVMPAAVCAPEIVVSKIAAVPEVMIEAAVETTIVEPVIEIAVSETPVAEILLAAPEPKAEAPAKTEAPAAAGKSAATGGVRVSQAFAKSSGVAAPVADDARVQAPSISAPPAAAADYQPDNDPGRVSRRQWWKHHLYVRSGRQAMEHPKA